MDQSHFVVALITTVHGERYVVEDETTGTYFGSFEPTTKGLKRAERYARTLRTNAGVYQ